MAERRKITSIRQLQILVEYMMQHREVALGRVRAKEARATAARCWREVTELLNLEGPARTSKEWTKIWNDLKSKVKQKVINNRNSIQATGGGPGVTHKLSPVEEMVANILGRDVGPLEGVRQEQFMTEMNQQDLTQEAAPTNDEAEMQEVLIESVTEDQPAMHIPSPPEQTVQSTPRQSPSERRSRAQRRLRQMQQSSQVMSSHLNDARQMVVKIEEMRAQAALFNAQSFHLVARSIDRFTKFYTRRQT